MVHLPSSAMGLTVVGILQLWAIGGAAAQAIERDHYRVIETKESKFQAELDRAANDGYRLVAGNAAIEFGIFQRASDGKRRTYTFVRDVDKFLTEKKLQPGFRFVAPAFFADDGWFSGIVEKVEGDEQPREYQFMKARSTGALRTRLEAGLETFTVIAVAAGRPGAAALLEKGEQARKATLLDSDVTGTIKKELGDAAARGFCVVDSEGIKQAVYALQECGQGQKTPLYEVIATTKTETLERELNAAAARGMRIVPESLIGIEKRLLFGNTYNNETLALLRQDADAAPVTYRVVGTMRLATFAKELNAAAADGFTLTAFAIGPKEMVGVLEKK